MKLSLNWLKEFVALAAEPSELKTAFTSLGLGVESLTEVETTPDSPPQLRRGLRGGDTVFDIEVTTNRPDCLSHLGVARELAAHYSLPLTMPKVKLKEPSSARGTKDRGRMTKDVVSIEIADADLCARYCGRVIENVEVKPSPAWLVERLEAVGQRSINNVADVTNYVLMELGHPLHAFDLARVGGAYHGRPAREHGQDAHATRAKIIVRRARPSERLRTLDGVDRTLTKDKLVIADAERAVALAGVMGGEESEISSSTHAVLLESAWFDPISIRRTSKSLGMHTEASHRFERGADIEMAPVALDRAAALIAEVAGGEVLRGIVDVYARRERPGAIGLRSSEILRILGSDVPAKDVERILRSLGFQVVLTKRGKSKVESRKSKVAFDSRPSTFDWSWKVTPPSWRPDISREVDFVEEVARHVGYDRLPSRLRVASRRIETNVAREKELEVSRRLTALGYHEIVVSSMVDPKENARFTDRPPVALANPLSQEASVLRSSTLPSMLAALRWNLDRDRKDLRLYEVGKIYVAKAEGVRKTGELPEERRVLTLGLSGSQQEAGVHLAARGLDFFDLKGDVETLFDAFEPDGARFESLSSDCYEPGFSGGFATLRVGEYLAVFGRLRAALARDYKLAQDVWLAEVDYDRLLGLNLAVRTFRPFSKFPAVERDFSLLVPEGVRYSQLAEALSTARAEDVLEVRPVERLPEAKIEPGFYSLLLRVKFQSANRTLTGEEISTLGQRLVRALTPLGVRLRS
jgi:phenylalanyl-tRNA synthetase beta chain